MESYLKTVQIVDLEKVKARVRETFLNACNKNSMQVCAVYSERSGQGKLLGTGWTDEEAWMDALEFVQKMDEPKEIESE